MTARRAAPSGGLSGVVTAVGAYRDLVAFGVFGRASATLAVLPGLRQEAADAIDELFGA